MPSRGDGEHDEMTKGAGVTRVQSARKSGTEVRHARSAERWERAAEHAPSSTVVLLAIVVLSALGVASTLAGFVLGWSP